LPIKIIIDAYVKLISMESSMDDENIVEIYSAANSVEAYAVVNALETAGIKAHVVGDFLENAFAGLQLGPTKAQSVWVLKQDEARARELLEKFKTEAASPPDDSKSSESEIDQSISEETTETAEQPPAGAQWRQGFISPLLVLFGVASISLGLYYAYENGRLLTVYSESAQAHFVEYKYDSLRKIGYSWFAYKVQNNLHHVAIPGKNSPGAEITIRYNPQHPAESYTAPILQPVWCAVIGIVIGGFALFLAFQFRASAVD
jgi:hypothetical protein